MKLLVFILPLVLPLGSQLMSCGGSGSRTACYIPLSSAEVVISPRHYRVNLDLRNAGGGCEPELLPPHSPLDIGIFP